MISYIRSFCHFLSGFARLYLSSFKKGGGVMEEQLELKHKYRPRRKDIIAIRVVFFLILTLILLTLLIFFGGRAIVNAVPEDVGYSVYEGLVRDGHTFLADLFFGDRYASFPRELTGTVDSREDGISVLFGDDRSSYKGGGFITLSPEGYDGKLVAVKNPLRFSLGISTQQSNTLSALMSLSSAQGIFSLKDSETDSPLIINGAWASKKTDGKFTYVGFREDGILCFGSASKEELEGKSLKFATEQEVYTLISGGVPQGFELKDLPLGAPSVSIGQCADGSVLVLFLEGDSSCRDAMEIMYKYNAFNAAMIYIGNDAAFLAKDSQAGSFSHKDAADSAHYHVTWIFR